jgi:tripartite-type tricarboxylate transporter receptor subunit TctC
MLFKHISAIASAILFTALAALPEAGAQEYPSRPVRIIVPYGAGGSGDTLARLLANRLSTVWGQTPIVDNRAGANGMLGTEAAARSEPDGHTLYLGTDGPMTISASLYKKVSYDWRRDFAPVSMVALLHQALIINAKLEARNLQEFIALAKRKPGALNYGSIGIGSSPQLGAEMFKSLAEISITHVPYRSAPAALTALLAGDIEMFMLGTPTAAPLIQNGTARGLAITAPARLEGIPDVPTFAEAWRPLDVSIWFSLFAPAATPPALVRKINADVVQVLSNPEFSRQLRLRGFDARPTSPEQLAEFLAKDYVKFRDLIQKLGLQVE